MKMVPLGDVITAAGPRSKGDLDLPVYSVTKHSGFVPSLEYFKKQVFSRETAGYRIVEPGEFSYATIHLDEGSIGVAPERALISPMYTVFKADPRYVFTPYLLRFLKSPRALASYEFMGSGAVHRRKAISLQTLSSMNVPLPSVEEQRRIASILDQADTLRTQRRAQLAHLDTLPQAVFHGMFGDVAPSRAFGEVIQNGPTNGLYHPASDYGGGTPILRIDGFDHGSVDDKTWRRVHISAEEISRYKLSINDIVINRVNALSHVGKSALIRHITEDCVYESNMMRVRIKEELVHPEFVIEWLQTPSTRHEIRRKAKLAINQASVNQGDIKSLGFPLPPRGRQSAFARKVESIQMKRATITQSLDFLDTLFASLQSRAFRGEL